MQTTAREAGAQTAEGFQDAADREQLISCGHLCVLAHTRQDWRAPSGMTALSYCHPSALPRPGRPGEEWPCCLCIAQQIKEAQFQTRKNVGIISGFPQKTIRQYKVVFVGKIWLQIIFFYKVMKTDLQQKE